MPVKVITLDTLSYLTNKLSKTPVQESCSAYTLTNRSSDINGTSANQIPSAQAIANVFNNILFCTTTVAATSSAHADVKSFTNGVLTINLSLPRGAAGPRGLQGERGPSGPSGPRGLQGLSGPSGPQGPQGPSGPTGPEGERGPSGPSGPRGVQGPSGPSGPSGPTGARGYLYRPSINTTSGNVVFTCASTAAASYQYKFFDATLPETPVNSISAKDFLASVMSFSNGTLTINLAS